MKWEMGKNKFARYGLKNNPFPEVAIANFDDLRPFIPFDEKFMKEIFVLIDSSISQKAWGGIPLVGKIGSGKTRLLFEVYERYRQSDRVKLIFVDNPGLSLKDFYAVIVGKVLEDKSLLTFLFQRYKENLMEIISRRPQTSLEYPSKIIFDISKRGIIYDALNNLMCEEEIFPDQSLARSFAIVLAYEITSKKEYFKDKISFVGSMQELLNDYRSAKDFLDGVRLPRRESARLKFEKRELDERTIINSGIKSLIRIFKLKGYEMLFLLIDQFERVVEQLPTRSMLSLLDGYRSLIDKNLENFSAVFACTTESWFESAAAYPSFKDRFADPAEIPKVTLEVAQKIVVAYCDEYRISSEYKGLPFPFDQKSISYIFTKSETIRDFLENCHMVLLKASLKSVSKIDEKSITQLL